MEVPKRRFRDLARSLLPSTARSRWTNLALTLALLGAVSLIRCGDHQQTAQHSVELAWDLSTSVVVGYNVYRGAQSGGPYTKLNTTPVPVALFTDHGVEAGKTYFYVTTAVDSNNLESTFSNEVSAAIPTR